MNSSRIDNAVSSFADTKTAEDPVQDVVGHINTYDFPQFIDDDAEVDGDKLVAAPLEERVRGRLQPADRATNAVPASRAGAGRQITVGFESCAMCRRSPT